MDRHVCVSQAVAQFAARRGPLAGRKTRLVIPNGVDLARFPASRAAGRTSRSVIRPAARLLPTSAGWTGKRGSTGCWRRRRSGCPSSRSATCSWWAKGPSGGNLEAQCRRLGLRRPGALCRLAAGCRRNPAGSRLLVLPSAWEGMPNVVLEAMAAGLPVVATDAEGVRELLGPAAAAQIVPFGDTAGVVREAGSVREDADIAAEIGAQNRRRVEENFSLAAMVAAYQDLWDSLLTGVLTRREKNFPGTYDAGRRWKFVLAGS